MNGLLVWDLYYRFGKDPVLILELSASSTGRDIIKNIIDLPE